MQQHAQHHFVGPLRLIFCAFVLKSFRGAWSDGLKDEDIILAIMRQMSRIDSDYHNDDIIKVLLLTRTNSLRVSVANAL